MKTPNEIWIPIPVAPDYELSNCKRVRNIKGGNFIKPRRYGNSTTFRLIVDKKRRDFSADYLSWLVFGTLPPKKSRIAVPVIISKGNERYYFDSLQRAAAFIAGREFYSVTNIRNYFFRLRKTNVFGWRINYQR